MAITSSSKLEIAESKEKQRGIIINCDKAIADIEANITALQDALAEQNQVKQQAQSILKDLDSDFPDIAVAEITPPGV